MSTPTDPHDEQPTSPSPQPPRRPWIGSNVLIIVYSALLVVVFCIIGFAPYTETFIEAVRKMFQRSSLRSTDVSETASTAIVEETTSACVIVWVEHKPDNLGQKSRATVWEQNVSDSVKAAGMTPREFYKLVVEHNPQLIRDDYEFKKGKVYLLPVCQ